MGGMDGRPVDCAEDEAEALQLCGCDVTVLPARLQCYVGAERMGGRRYRVRLRRIARCLSRFPRRGTVPVRSSGGIAAAEALLQFQFPIGTCVAVATLWQLDDRGQTRFRAKWTRMVSLRPGQCGTGVRHAPTSFAILVADAERRLPAGDLAMDVVEREAGAAERRLCGGIRDDEGRSIRV